jgi:hypothetical protein
MIFLHSNRFGTVMGADPHRHPDPFVSKGTDPRILIRIRIRIKMSVDSVHCFTAGLSSHTGT